MFAQIGLLAATPTLGRGEPRSAAAAPRGAPLGSGYHPPSIRPPTRSKIARIGPLGTPNSIGLRLPQGFTARVVARSGELVPGSNYRWHPAPDGGATFLANDGSYVYVSNSEMDRWGGVGALRFDAQGQLLDAYPILTGTRANCAGGPTPWGTWLSCEEVDDGRVFECDPFGAATSEVRPALGVFKHEAVTVDPVNNQLYLTEDVHDGRLYRFNPKRLLHGRPDLTAGTLDVLRVTSGIEGPVEWLRISDPSAARRPTRQQVRHSTAFHGGEGVWWHRGVVYFTTKGDNRVWAYDTGRSELVILYDAATAPNALLTGVDNVVVSASGDVIVAEDDGDMQLVALANGGKRLVPLVQVIGHKYSEITGPALDPYRRRLYFSSQRGTSGRSSGGVTYEITGPFFV